MYKTWLKIHYFNIPKIVIEGFNFPSELNNGRLSIFANGLLGFGSHGVPSSLVQVPTVEFQPTTLKKRAKIWNKKIFINSSNILEKFYTLKLWRTPSLSELTLIIFYMKLTHLGSKASICLVIHQNVSEFIEFIWQDALFYMESLFLRKNWQSMIRHNFLFHYQYLDIM